MASVMELREVKGGFGFLDYESNELTNKLQKIEAICAKNNFFGKSESVCQAQEMIALLQERIARLQKISKLL